MLQLTHSRARVVELLRRGSVGQITADWNLPVLREDLLLQSFRCRLGWSHAGVACMSVAAIGLTKMALHYDIAGQCHRTSSRTSPGNVIEQLPATLCLEKEALVQELGASREALQRELG